MQKLPYAQILERLGEVDRSALRRLLMGVLRNVVVEPIEPYLRHLACQIGFDAQCQFGEYDQVFQEAVGEDSGLLDQETDCALVFLRLENLSWDLARNFPSMKPAQVEAEKERVREFILTVVSSVRKQTAAMILWFGFELPVYPALGIVDRQCDDGQTGAIDELNRSLREALRRHQNAYFVDLNLCLSRIGVRNFYDQRYWHIGKAPYSREALEEMAGETFKYIRAL